METLGNLLTVATIERVITIVGFLLGIFGLYTWRKSFGAISYQRSGESVIDVTKNEFGKNIGMSYRNDKIDRLSISYVALWNSGHSPVRAEDVASSDPFRIKLKKGYKVLDHQIVTYSTDANNVRITDANDRNELTIKFDYLNSNDGFVIKILHNDPSVIVDLRGSAAGCKNIKNKGYLSLHSDKTSGFFQAIIGISINRYILSITSAISGGVFILLFFYHVELRELTKSTDDFMNDVFSKYVFLFTGVSLLLSSFLGIIQRSMGAPNSISRNKNISDDVHQLDVFG